MDLPEAIAAAVAPLFAAIPREQAMPNLTGSAPKQTALIETILQNPALKNRPELAAGLWLYADDLERSHTLSQSIEDATGSYWHGIMHRREGDFSNAHYWMRRAARHPLFAERPELDSVGLIDAAAQARGGSPAALVARQREEWAALFAWCACAAAEPNEKPRR